MGTKRANAAGSWARVTGQTAAAEIKAGPGVLHRLVISNGDVAAQTVTLVDGETGGDPEGDVLCVYTVPAETSVSLDFEMAFTTAIEVTPSDNAVDVLVLFD